jgi:hypothetical protein
MKRMFLIPLLGAVMLNGCSKSIKETMVTEENKDKIFEQIKDSKGLTVEEVGHLQGYMMRHALKDAFSGGKPSIPTGKTIGQMIEEQKQFVADAKVREEEDKRRREAARAEAERQRKQLLNALAVTVYDKGYTTYEFNGEIDDMTFKFVFQNKTKKDIKGFKGAMVCKDMFGEVIKRLGVEESETLPAGKSKRTELVYGYNQFMNEDAKLVQAKISDLKTEWEPKTILFTDGTSLEVKSEDKLGP